jgi:phospholipid/cholesterol/gamma-HCH transport system substrate-binding protein
MTAPLNPERAPRYKLAGLAGAVILLLAALAVAGQFRGDFTPKATLTVLSGRAGLVMDPGSKVTFNGVPIGRVASVSLVTVDGAAKARLSLDVAPKYLQLIPANVNAAITASTVFGNKYVSFSSPASPSPQSISTADVIDASSVTTEFNTLFETITSISQKVDPIKLNQTLTAVAQALDGLGHRFGESIANGADILADLNQRMPEIRSDIQRFADVADVYTAASPDLWAFLDNAVTTARTLNGQQGSLDAALMSSIGFGNTGADILERGGPYLVRGQADLVPTTALLDAYSPEFYCAIRNLHDVEPSVKAAQSGNGYSLQAVSEALGAPNPYVYPDNLPRVNASGGPEGRPGCWQPITRDLWPAPLLVTDTGFSLAPYNHFGLGQPLLTEYVWGRQVGENTINP